MCFIADTPFNIECERYSYLIRIDPSLGESFSLSHSGGSSGAADMFDLC